MIQGTAAQITKFAAIIFFQWLIDTGYIFKVLIPNLIHDEIMVECPDELIKEVAFMLQGCMERAGDHFVKVVKLKAVPEIEKYWKH